ncbi:hypothetical protein LCGC14_0800330 [marine sediment metagenome]|uniref:Uncharacterized protein n=1 Tax=marine sediment metagenome TaxID=412755 RepID=A0A0F9PUD4_9ZZZZ
MPANPRAALAAEANLTHKQLPERQRRVAKIANAVPDGTRLTLTIKILEEQNGKLVEVDEVEKIIPSNELNGTAEEVMVRMKTRREHVLTEYHAKLAAQNLIGDEYAF